MSQWKNSKKRLSAVWNDDSAQGATEYILILVAVVTVAFMLRNQIKNFVQGRLTNLGGEIESFNVERQ